MASKRNGTLYTGVTSNLVKRIGEHKHNQIEGFTKKYNVKELVFFEIHANAESAITREKQIKKMAKSLEIAADKRKEPKLGRFV